MEIIPLHAGKKKLREEICFFSMKAERRKIEVGEKSWSLVLG